MGMMRPVGPKGFYVGSLWGSVGTTSIQLRQRLVLVEA